MQMNKDIRNYLPPALLSYLYLFHSLLFNKQAPGIFALLWSSPSVDVPSPHRK